MVPNVTNDEESKSPNGLQIRCGIKKFLTESLFQVVAPLDPESIYESTKTSFPKRTWSVHASGEFLKVILFEKARFFKINII